MDAAERKRLTALYADVTGKLAWHRAMMADNAAWLDAMAGRREMAEEIARDLAGVAAGIVRDLGYFPAAVVAGQVIK